MKDVGSVLLQSLKVQGEEILNQVGTQLMSNPHFMQALQTALRGKDRLDQTVAQALKTMNVPTRAQFRGALARIDGLERELAAVRTELATLSAAPAATTTEATAGATSEAAPTTSPRPSPTTSPRPSPTTSPKPSPRKRTRRVASPAGARRPAKAGKRAARS